MSFLFIIQDADIKAKLRNLRTQYGKELGKVKASVVSGAGTNSVYEPSWRFYDSLHFLRDSITPVKTKPTSGVPVVESETASSEVLLVPSEDINNEDILNDPNELNKDDDISRPFDILAQSQNDPCKSAKSKAKAREKMENIILQKSLTVLDKLGNKRKHTEELDGDETFGRHVAHSLRQIEDRRSNFCLMLSLADRINCHPLLGHLKVKD